MELTSYLLGKKASGGGGGGSTRDWAKIGYSSEPAYIQEGYDYALQIKENWSSPSSMSNLFNGDTNLIYMPYVQINPNANSTVSMFANCSRLEKVPLLDFSNIVEMRSMFNACSSLIEVPAFNTKSVNTIANMFSGCANLQSISQINTSNVENMSGAFGSCSRLVTVPELDGSKCRNVGNMFGSCVRLENFGGLKDYGKAFLPSDNKNSTVFTLSLNSSNSLTHDSLMNVINNLYDIASAGVPQQTLQLGYRNIGKLTEEEIAIATNKGWQVS